MGINVRRVADGGRGDYRFPYGRTVDEMKTPEFEAKMKAGPVGNMSILPSGDMNMGKLMGQWFVHSLVNAQGGFMESSQLDSLRQLAACFRSGIEGARAGKVPGALPYFPEGACRLTSRLFALHLARRTDGALFAPARVVSGVLPGSELGARHYWLEVDEAVVDLTADAFGESAIVVGEPTAFHHTLTAHVRESAAENLASLSADEMARLVRQLTAIEQRMPAFVAPPA